jgi:hypothetical protein
VEPFWADGRRSDREAGVGTLVPTRAVHEPGAVDLLAAEDADARGPEIWDEIVARAQAQFDGPVVLGTDALVLHVGAAA